MESENRLNIPPANNEIEISIFGPGKGESILIHVGDDKWFIVDSCLDPDSKEPAPLKYLKQINVDPSISVQQIIVSHWHDDHIGGLGEVVEVCSSAEFVCSSALSAEEHLSLISAYERGISPAMGTGVDNFKQVVEVLLARKKTGRSIPIKFATENTPLWNKYNSKIYSLSPSHASILAAKLDFDKLLPVYKKPKRRLMATTPNRAAVVLWIEIGELNFLLGSDLEEEGRPDVGWSVIVDSSMRPSGKASFFKVPHHGSDNAHHPRVWSDMLVNDPVSVLTPFVNGGIKLPKKKSLERICSFTTEAFSTASPVAKKPRKRDNTVKKSIKEFTLSFKEVNSSYGHVRYRIKPPNPCSIELFGNALHLEELIKSM